jgi:hypothetical protein
MMNMHLSSSDVLYASDWQCDVTASRKLYYGKYPYKMTVSLMAAGSTDWNELCMFEHEFVDFADNVLDSANRKYWRMSRQLMYFSTFADLSKAYAIYKSVALQISGPVTQEHLAVITSPDTEYNPRKTLYRNSFDCHVRVWTRWLRSWRSPSWARSRTADMNEFFAQSLTNREFGEAYGVDMYTNYDEFLEVMPFFKLQFADYRIYIERCCLPSLQK